MKNKSFLFASICMITLIILHLSYAAYIGDILSNFQRLFAIATYSVITIFFQYCYQIGLPKINERNILIIIIISSIIISSNCLLTQLSPIHPFIIIMDILDIYYLTKIFTKDND